MSSGHTALEHPEDAVLGRSGSPAASWSTASRRPSPERAVLALPHQFRGSVDVDALRVMGEKGEFCVPEVTELDRDHGIALLDRAADIGLLTAYGGGYYGIHPALPWFFHALFRRHYGPDDGPVADRIRRAYVHTVAVLGYHYFEQLEQGDGRWLSMLRIEEDNLLHAFDMAGAWQHADDEVRILGGLSKLYDATGRDTEWARLVERVLPRFLTPDGQARPGREEQYGVVTGWQVHIRQHPPDAG